MGELTTNTEIKLAVLDVAGTTAADDGLVVRAFQVAMEPLDPTPEELAEMTSYVESTMGQRKIDVFRHLCKGDEESAFEAHERFVTSYTDLVAEGQMHEFAGVSEFFKELRNRGIGISLTSGFPREIFDPILFELGWLELIDFSVAASEVKDGRPAPDMILRSIELYNEKTGQSITPDQVVVAGDTDSDMKAGVAAGVRVVLGVTSGAHNAEQLTQAGATHISASVLSLSELI